jgi:hypothetical protein
MQCDASPCRCLYVDGIVCQSRIDQGTQVRAVDVDVDLHCLAGAWLGPGQSMYGDRWVSHIAGHLNLTIFFHYYNAEQLLADKLVAVAEVLITMEALAILPGLGNFGLG